MDLRWYAVHSQPHKEQLLWDQLLSRNVDCFYPRVRVQPVNPRSSKIRPYFPGYLFVHTDIQAVGMSTFQWMPYATGLVVFGGEPATVPDALIFALKRRLAEIDAAGGEVLQGLQHGDRVDIQAGPFAGYEAIFDMRLPGTTRVRVLLKMLSSRNLPVELDASAIQKQKK